MFKIGHDWATSLSLFTFMHWRRKWQPTPVFLPGESHGWRSLVGYSPRGRKESDTTERLHFTFQRLALPRGVLQDGRPFLLYFLSAFPCLCCLLTVAPLCFSLPDSIKEPDIQTPTRWFYWDTRLPFSRSASSLHKVIFLASAPHLWFIGFISLSCSEQSVLGLSNRGRAQALGEQMEQVPWNQMPLASMPPFVLPARLVRNWADPRHGWKCSFHLAKPVCQVYRISDGEKIMTGTPQIMQVEN